MANFGSLKTALRGLINRKDLTDALAGDFVNRAIDEIQRTTRLPSQEALATATDWSNGNNQIAVPGNYMELISIFTDDGELKATEKQEWFRTRNEGRPRLFMKMGGNWVIKPTPADGTPVYVQFYMETTWLVQDADVNTWTRSAFNAVLYGAAALAADYFQMEDVYVQRFAGKNAQLVTAIQQQDYDDRWSGQQTIGPVYGHGDY
jgi:hypothetical protein